MIALELEPGQYNLKITPLGFGNVDTTRCQSVTFEFAIAPKDITDSRIENIPCNGQLLFPKQFDFAPLEVGEKFHYDSLASGSHYNIEQNYNETATNKVSQTANIISKKATSHPKQNFIESYPFTLERRPGRSPVYHVSATLGSDFLTGGSVRLLLVAGNDKPQCTVVRF